jgi:tetratricopeptide (TPR) repeat protein
VKWFIIALAAAAALIGIGLVATGSHEDGRVSRNPEAAALCEEGTADLHAYRFQAAVEKLGRSLEEDPSLAEASISRTMAFLTLRERNNMKRELARADSLTETLRDDQRRLVAQLRLGTLPESRYYAMRDSVYDLLLKRTPNDIYVLEVEAERAKQEGDPEKAASVWRRILDGNPNYAKAYNELGYIELNRGNYDLAIEHMQKYAFLAPNLANPHDSLGDVYRVLGRYEEAEAEYQAAVRMQPDFYFSLINIGKVYLARGQLKRGIEILETLRTQFAGSELESGVDREIIGTYLRAGLTSELDEAARRFIGRYPDAEDASIYRATRLAYLGREAEARAVMDSSLAEARASKRYSEHPGERDGVEFAALQFDGITADLRGDRAHAAEAWAAAIEILKHKLPDYELFSLRIRLADALRGSSRPREALAQIDQVLAVNPRLPEMLRLKAQCHRDLGDTEAAALALTQLDRALAKADPDLPILREAAELHRQLGGGQPVP